MTGQAINVTGGLWLHKFRRADFGCRIWRNTRHGENQDT